MTVDPGHPFSQPYADLIAALEDRIRYGVEQPARARFVFNFEVKTYELPRLGYAISSVSGLVGSRFTIFRPGTDYQFASNRVIWLNENRAQSPDEGSRLDVEYTYREQPAGLTDFNPGSVVGTLVRAVAREFKLMYEQMDEAYRRAFIDQASGVGLDNVVALLGVVRNPATKANGAVTFFRDSAPDAEIEIPAGTQVTDESGRSFLTIETARLPLTIDEFRVPQGGALRMTNRVAEVVGIWPEALRQPEQTPENSLAIQDTTPDEPFGLDQRTITLAAGVESSGRLLVRYRPASVTVRIEAEQPGPDGNVNAETITIMPTPPTGIDGVINEAPVEEGHDPEDDDQLRERAKHALERSGNATLNAIKYAVLEVDGVEAVEVMDYTVDDSIPLGEVHVRYTGGDENEVRRVVEETRAAGILARLEIITEVQVLGTIYVIPAPGVPETNLNTARGIYRQIIVEALEALNVGEPLSVRRLVSRVFEVNGLADAAEAQLRKSTDTDSGRYEDTLLVDKSQLLRPDVDNLHVALIQAVAVSQSKKDKDNNFQLTIQLQDQTGAAVHFGSYAIDLNVTLRATSTKGAGVERLNNFTRRVTFTNKATVTLTITRADDLKAFRPDDHDTSVEVVITAAAYAGIAGAREVIKVS